MSDDRADIVTICFCENHMFYHAFYHPVDKGRPVAVEIGEKGTSIAGPIWTMADSRIKRAVDILEDIDGITVG